MDTDKILYYTDGHLVTITDNGFKVKNTIYQLNGITRHGLSIVSPARVPSTILMILGTLFFVCGSLNFIPESWNTDILILGFPMLVNSVLMAGGVFLLVIGLLIMLRLREKYAVRIYTAEGEKNVVISNSREYINQIIDALNRAFLDLMNSPRSAKQKKFEVSAK